MVQYLVGRPTNHVIAREPNDILAPGQYFGILGDMVGKYHFVYSGIKTFYCPSRQNDISQPFRLTCVKNARSNFFARCCVSTYFYFKIMSSSVWCLLLGIYCNCYKKRYYRPCVNILSLQNPPLIIIS